jgi:dienelactone hydrolase
MTTIVASLALALLTAAGAAAPPEATPKAEAAPAESPLRAEARRRNDALVKEGFNTTRGLGVKGESLSLRTALLVPPHGDEEHVLRLWAEAAKGEVSYRLLGPGGEVLLSLQGRSVESTLVRALPSGTYTLDFSATTPEGGRGVLGVKGPVMGLCKPDPARLAERAAQPAQGFHWPYLLFLPKGPATSVLVAPNNSGFGSDDLALLRASALCEVDRQAGLAERLGAALLVPLFPRPPVAGEEENLYLHALVRAALTTSQRPLARVDLQLGAMLDDARARLAREGQKVPARALFWGFSASGSFVNRYALLHPERVLAVASGSPGGWPIAPVEEDGGEPLPYPVGVKDLKALTGQPFDLAALRQVSHFFFLGGDDLNDAVPYRDSFSKADEELVFRRFGKTPVGRWGAAERLYREQKLDARFKLYPGVAHQVTPEMEADIEAFFAEALRRARAAGK